MPSPPFLFSLSLIALMQEKERNSFISLLGWSAFDPMTWLKSLTSVDPISYAAASMKDFIN